MSLRGAAAVIGLAERAPSRYTDGETNLDVLAGVGVDAIRDAGLTLADIDGLVVHPIGGLPGFVPATVAEHLGLRPRYAELVDLGGATSAGMVWRAAAAIAAGMCTTCLCLTGTRRRRRPPPAPSNGGSRSASRAGRDRSPHAEFEAPYGSIGANVGYAQLAARYDHEYGSSDASRAKVAVDQRANAGANPDAIFHGQPLTIDDVLASEMICEPLRRLEIVMPAAGAAALVVTAADRAPLGPHQPVWLLGAGESVTHSSLAQAPSLTETGVAIAADAAFSMAGVDRTDVGLASLYDCYTIMVLLSLEDAGFCPKGEAAAFVTEHDLCWSGDFPVNTHGGQLSFGQPGMAGGMSHVTEAVRQLQGRAAGRQIADLEVAYVHGNGGIIAEQVGLVLSGSR
ncbi:MAG: thiolase family protein [Acidimicrobiales bacterium]